MRVLLIGDNAVSHAVADTLARSAELYSIMRRENPGIKKLSMSYLIQEKPKPKEINAFAKKNQITYAIVLSRTFINKSVVDELEKITTVIGPSVEAAKIEWDKTYAKEICEKLNIKTPYYIIVKTNEELKKALEEFKNIEISIKPNYYTMGRGTRFFKANDKDAYKYGAEILKKGSAIIEPKINGKNFVVMGFTEGKNIVIAPPVEVLRYYKGYISQGYASCTTGYILDFLNKSDIEYARESLRKVINYLRDKNLTIKGSFGAEFIKSNNELYLTGFSSTFNDPASLNVLPLLRQELPVILSDIIEGTIKAVSFNIYSNVCKFFFAKGYPNAKPNLKVYINERCIWNLGIRYFFQGLKEKQNAFYTTSSRSIALVTRDETIEKAEKAINEAAKCIKGLEYVERAFY